MITRNPNRLAVELGYPDVHVELAIDTTEPLDRDAVALVMADVATLIQSVRSHSRPPRPSMSAPAPAYTRLSEAFDGKRT